jgi:pyruvate dehydrogenase E1 component beta subunit
MKSVQRLLMSGSEAIRYAFICASKKIKNLVLISEGVLDPSAFYGTTKGLNRYFKKDRIIEMPLSESALTGVSVGAAINGIRPVLNYHRVEFALLAMEQIINNAAKSSYISYGKHKVPFVLRLVIGRGWGQGPSHSQSLENFFSSVPGLKVVMPTFPNDSKELLIGAIMDNNPVIIIEHRWCHYIKEKVKVGYSSSSLESGPKKIINGKDYTVVATSYMVLESIEASKILKKFGINIEVFDLRILRPLKLKKIISSVKKTGRLLTVDTGFKILGIGSEIVSEISEKCFKNLKSSPKRLGFPDHPTPSSRGYLKNVYPDFYKICKVITRDLKISTSVWHLIKKEIKIRTNKFTDIPNQLFKGPF